MNDSIFWEVPIVLMSPIPGTSKIQCKKSTIKINPNYVGTVCKANLPSELSGSDGNAMATAGTKINVFGEVLFVSMPESEFCTELEKRLNAT